MDKYMSVITNFGCHYSCPYCIVKNNNLQIPKSTIDGLNSLEEEIKKNQCNWVSISGGGDPFYDWQNNIDFYNHMYELATKYGKKLDIHTRILPTDMDLIKKFRKIALSIEPYDTRAMERLQVILPEIEKTTKLRVINVLNERMTTEDCLDYINKMHNIGVKQITFRQMFGNKNAYQNFLNIKNTINIPGVMFLPDGEYHHYYFTTNNKLYPYFFGYTENDRKVWMKKYEEIEQYCG